MAVPSHTSCPADGSLPDVAAASWVTALVAPTGLPHWVHATRYGAASAVFRVYPLPGASDGARFPSLGALARTYAAYTDIVARRSICTPRRRVQDVDGTGGEHGRKYSRS